MGLTRFRISSGVEGGNSRICATGFGPAEIDRESAPRGRRAATGRLRVPLAGHQRGAGQEVPRGKRQRNGRENLDDERRLDQAAGEQLKQTVMLVTGAILRGCRLGGSPRSEQMGQPMPEPAQGNGRKPERFVAVTEQTGRGRACGSVRVPVPIAVLVQGCGGSARWREAGMRVCWSIPSMLDPSMQGGIDPDRARQGEAERQIPGDPCSYPHHRSVFVISVHDFAATTQSPTVLISSRGIHSKYGSHSTLDAQAKGIVDRSQAVK